MSLRPTQPASASMHLALCVGIALLLHVPLVVWLDRWRPTAAESIALSATASDNQDFRVNLVTPSVPEKPKPDDPAHEEDNLQFVTAPLPDVEETPDHARFLDRVSSKTERETVRKAAPGAPATPKPTPRPEAQREERQPEPAAAERADKAEKAVKGADETLPEGGELARSQMPDVPLRAAKPAPLGGGQPSSVPMPRLADAPMVNPQGDNGSFDYLRDVDEGDKTLLNRKESRYWAFFDRVKVQIADEWAPVSTYRKRDPFGNVYGVKDRYSQVKVTLNSDGSVRQLYVARPSGLEFFDDEAVRSIRAAAPFHNPPEGLKDEDGLVTFTFGFYFEVTAGPTMRIFK